MGAWSIFPVTVNVLLSVREQDTAASNTIPVKNIFS